MNAPAIAVVGGGPRGISLVERLLIQASDQLRIDVYDSDLIGGGRIWRPDQSPLLLMNSHLRGPTIFSGPPDDGPARAGAGPSLLEWLGGDDEVYNGYAPRGKYGQYLHFAFRCMVANAAEHLTVGEFHDTVTAVRAIAPGIYSVATASGAVREYDAVVLATGHPRPRLPEDAAVTSAALARMMVADSAAELPLGEIAPGEPIAAIGMGLSFHDIVALLTQGRGGVFHTGDDGVLTYQPSGEEPAIVGMSRSGLPIPARGRNQKPRGFAFRPRLCTVQRMRELRSLRPADFRTEVEPWITAETAVTYCHAVITSGAEPERAQEFLARVPHADPADPVDSVYRMAEEFGVASRLPTLAALARPFDTERFTSHRHWTDALTTFLQRDLDHAREGNLSNPLKAALDTLRDIRPSISAVVDNGGLSPESHEHDFLADYAPCYALLVGGPPIHRVAELLALIRAGVVRIAGPHAQVVEDGTALAVRSPSVPEPLPVHRVVDARMPPFDLNRFGSGLYPGLLADGLLRRFRHQGLADSVDTGACEVDPATNAAIGSDGTPTPGLFILGIPTERQRWFTQIGGRRVGSSGTFARDAEQVAGAVIATLAERRTAVP